MWKGGNHEIRKQFIPCKEEVRVIARRGSGEAGRKQADDFEVGDRRDAAGYPAIEEDVFIVQCFFGRFDFLRCGYEGNRADD